MANIVLGSVIIYAKKGSQVVKITDISSDEVKFAVEGSTVNITQAGTGSTTIKKFKSGVNGTFEFTQNAINKFQLSLLQAGYDWSNTISTNEKLGEVAFDTKIKCLPSIELFIYQEFIDCDETVYSDNADNPYTLHIPRAVSDLNFGLAFSESSETKLVHKFELLPDENKNIAYQGKPLDNPIAP